MHVLHIFCFYHSLNILEDILNISLITVDI
jgi:hypothetical protein